MTSRPRATTSTILLVLAAAAGAAAFLAATAGTAAAATSAALEPTNTCWRTVVNDWLDNGQVDKVYAIPCYTQAIQHLNLYPDLKGYSSAIDDIQRAELAAIHQDRGFTSPQDDNSSSNDRHASGVVPPGPGGGGGGGNGPPGPTKGPSSPLGDIGPSSATAVPLPLIVLGALAVLLLLAAGGTWLARRLQSRRMTPAPSPVPASPKRR